MSVVAWVFLLAKGKQIMPFDNPGMVAGGDIRPSRFVKISTVADYTLLECDANDPVFGVGHESTQDAPIPNADPDAAEAGDQLAVYPIGSVCLLKIGLGGCARGDELKSDNDGKGVARATTGTTIQNVGAIALESALEDDLARVLVVRYPLRPALV